VSACCRTTSRLRRLHRHLQAPSYQHHLVFFSSQYITNSLLSSAKKALNIHCAFTLPTRNARTFQFGIPTEYPTDDFRQCLPPPQPLTRASRQLSPRRKSRSPPPLRSRKRRPRKMTTTRTRILMIPKAKGKKLAPRVKNTILLQSHTLLRRSMPKTQA
jgi:hypothetical protein